VTSITPLIVAIEASACYSLNERPSPGKLAKRLFASCYFLSLFHWLI